MVFKLLKSNHIIRFFALEMAKVNCMRSFKRDAFACVFGIVLWYLSTFFFPEKRFCLKNLENIGNTCLSFSIIATDLKEDLNLL